MIRISDLRSLGSAWCIKGTAESAMDKDSAVPLMHHDPSDLGPDHPKERSLWHMSLRFSAK